MDKQQTRGTAKEDRMDQDIRIVVAQRGWIFVGEYSEEDGHAGLGHAKCIRRWGTTKGLGQLAEVGPQSGTVLDHAGVVRVPMANKIADIACIGGKWSL